MRRFRQIFIGVVTVLLLFSAMAYGDTWTGNRRLTTNVGDSRYPAVAVDGLNIYVVWQDNTPDLLNEEIYFKKSVDGGAKWTTNKRLTYTTGDSYAPAIAVNGSNIYVVWQDHTLGNPEIYFRGSEDGGVTWGATRNLSKNNMGSYYPSIAVSGSSIYVVWEDYSPLYPDIYFKRSDDGGVTWTKTKNLSNAAGYSIGPAIAVDGSNVYVVWYDDTPGNFDIYFISSDDGGVTWKATQNISKNTMGSNSPAIAVDGSNVYVVWVDYTPGNLDIYFKKSDDGGVAWEKTKNLSKNPGSSDKPAIAVDGSNIFMVWHDDTPENYEIFFKKSVDGGATWATSKRLTNDTTGSMYPAMAVDLSNVYVVWQNFYTGTAPNLEIYFKKGVMD